MDIEKLRLPPGKSTKKKKKQTQRQPCKFIKGPIPIVWLREAFKLPPNAIQVSLAIWYQWGITEARAKDKKLKSIILTTQKCQELGLSRFTKYRGLNHLEAAGLIKVERRRKQNPIIIIQEVKP